MGHTNPSERLVSDTGPKLYVNEPTLAPRVHHPLNPDRVRSQRGLMGRYHTGQPMGEGR